MSVNKVILVGNVGRKPEIRYVGQRPVATCSLATTERTEWHNLVMWDRAAEIAERYIDKGTKLFVEGKLRTRVWQDANAIKHNITEIIVDNFDILSRKS